jgi:hypothetical protein
MSKCMHITVTVSPYYQKELRDAYPKLARHLGFLAPELVQRNPSLYALAGRLDQLLYTFDSTPLREVLLRQREKLLQLHKNIEKEIADWNLAQADKLLYKLEDIFDDIEAQLDS